MACLGKYYLMRWEFALFPTKMTYRIKKLKGNMPVLWRKTKGLHEMGPFLSCILLKSKVDSFAFSNFCFVFSFFIYLQPNFGV